MKKLADDEEPTVLIPLIVEPVEVEVPVGLVGIDVRDIAIAMQVHDRAVEMYTRLSMTLPLECS